MKIKKKSGMKFKNPNFYNFFHLKKQSSLLSLIQVNQDILPLDILQNDFLRESNILIQLVSNHRLQVVELSMDFDSSHIYRIILLSRIAFLRIIGVAISNFHSKKFFFRKILFFSRKIEASNANNIKLYFLHRFINKIY